MGPVVFSIPEQAWRDRLPVQVYALPAQVSALPYSTQPGPACTPWRKTCSPGSGTKGASFRHQQVRAWELEVEGGQG